MRHSSYLQSASANVKKTLLGIALTSLAYSPFAGANADLIRWTGSEDTDASIQHVVQVLNLKLNTTLSAKDFTLQEDRDLAFNHYQRYVQLIEGAPVNGKTIRIWKDFTSGNAIQVEANIDTKQAVFTLLAQHRKNHKTVSQLRSGLNSQETLRIVRLVVEQRKDDSFVQGVTWNDEWKNSQLVRLVKVRGKRGYHHVTIELKSKSVLSTDYREFPQADLPETEVAAAFTIPAQVYPIYEEVEKGIKLPRITTELKHLHVKIPQMSGDIYAPLKTRRYFGYQYDPVLGETKAGQELGYWSMSGIKRQAENIRNGLPMVENTYTSGVLLQGDYATINLHPDAVTEYAPLSFAAQPSSALFPQWVMSTQGEEMIPNFAFAGKPILSAQEAFNRPATRDPQNDPKVYINEGFDEIQVYHAIDTLFSELHKRGFKDPDLSTRPFNAFLFNPDIAYRDNAYYTDDTINFTTYSADYSNAARNNTTIWHELGHGLMDRLMGDHIDLADTGGLSEGMADFVAAMLVQAVTQGKPFPGDHDLRIINQTGFYLTNEVHDDGEAYGGVMKDFMDSVIAKNPATGLEQVVDVVLEAMRLTRDYPGLTAPEWFSHILFADSLGRPGLRASNELGSFLINSLAGRNFRMDGGAVATFSLVNMATNQEVTGSSLGSRRAPIQLKLNKTETADFKVKVSLKNAGSFAFKFPVEVRVQFEGGPIEGAVEWTGEDKGSKTYVLNSEADAVEIPLQVNGTCDYVNRADGSCVDYTYIQIFDQGEKKVPRAKKRFYVSVKN